MKYIILLLIYTLHLVWCVCITIFLGYIFILFSFLYDFKNPHINIWEYDDNDKMSEYFGQYNHNLCFKSVFHWYIYKIKKLYNIK